MSKVGIYPGSFDPLTLGHLDIIERSLHVVERLIIAVSDNDKKNHMFDADIRVSLIKDTVDSFDDNLKKKITVEKFDHLLVDYAKSKNSNIIIRGLRAVSDFEYEFQLATMNRSLAPDIESIFLTPKESLIYVSSSLIKEISGLNGDISKFVHPIVEQALKAKQSV